MPEALRPVPYAEVPAPSGLVLSALPFEATLAAIRSALRAEDLWLIHEIDPQAIVARAGYGIGPTRQLLFFHPRYMARLLAGNPHALVEVPLKLAVMELPDGRVGVRHPDVASALGAYRGLETLAAELGGICARLMEGLRPRA